VDSRVVDSSCIQRDEDRGFACSDYYACGLKRMWADVNLAVERILFDRSFADVCADSRRKSVLTDMRKNLVRIDA